jgi:hypothetical protein
MVFEKIIICEYKNKKDIANGLNNLIKFIREVSSYDGKNTYCLDNFEKWVKNWVRKI